MSFIEVIVLAIIEGLTEFLPVSSTGHMILATAFMGIESTPFVKLFTIAIQLGTILSVLVLYYKRFFRSVQFYLKLVVAAIPAAILGFLFSGHIDLLLESPMTVGIMLVVGGVVLLFVDRWVHRPVQDDSDEITYAQAFKIGLFQCLALIPGTSRSASTIVGGMTQRLTRKAAAEFSFFLAIPMMFGATLLKLKDHFDDGHALSSAEINQLLVGNVVGFLVAILAIKFFIGVISKYGFKAFGWYRIAVGGLIIALLLSGQSLQLI